MTSYFEALHVKGGGDARTYDEWLWRQGRALLARESSTGARRTAAKLRRVIEDRRAQRGETAPAPWDRGGR